MPVLVDFSVKNTFSINETVVLLIETESSLRRTAAGEYAKPAAQKGCASYAQGLAPPFCADPGTTCCRGLVFLHVNFLCSVFLFYVMSNKVETSLYRSLHSLRSVEMIKKLIFSENALTKNCITVYCNSDFLH